MLSLDVAISTYRPEGIERVVKMLHPIPQQEGVKFVVSWQEHNNSEIPEYLSKRPDVEIYRLDEKGVSNNRNNAIDNCHSDLILIADDDLEYDELAFENIKRIFEENPKVDLATFKFNYPIPKQYPENNSQLTVPYPKNYYGSNVEIAFRRQNIGDLRYWDGIGLGQEELSTGEDELFLISAIKRGLNCRFFDILIGTHPNLTTGKKTSPGILRGQGFLINLIYPKSWLLRNILKAYRIYRNSHGSFYNSLFQLNKGAIIRMKRWSEIPKNAKW